MRVIVIVLLAVLTACTPLPQSPSDADPGAVVSSQHLEHWSSVGRVSVRIPEDSWTANYRWIQDDAEFDLLLTGPLGVGSMQLRGNPQRVVLDDSDGGHYESDNVQALLLSRLGVAIPVDAMRYWGVGRLIPDVPAVVTRDHQGRLLTLEQSQWRMKFERYQVIAGYELPGKITLLKDRWKIRILPQYWVTGGDPELRAEKLDVLVSGSFEE